MTKQTWSLDRVGPETKKSSDKRVALYTNSFYNRFMIGFGLDVGFGGGSRCPVLPTAIGIDKGFPGYDGHNLPFADDSQDYVFNSHCLEHLLNPIGAIREWFRVVKTTKHLIIIVPHKLLYEKKHSLPSKYNQDHKMFYTPASLMEIVEMALMDNTYRIRHLRDNDDGFNYNLKPDTHSTGCYEIELVIQKINKPDWELV